MTPESMHPFDNFFSPRKVAVVGVSDKPGKIGHEIFRGILQPAFKGKVYPIGRVERVLGLKCYQSMSEIPDDIDLAIYALPAKTVVSLIEEAGSKGVRNVIIVSGGFKEIGENGETYQERLLNIAKRYGIRIIGPNCIGVFDGETQFDTFFYPHEKMKRPKEGKISFITQSGTFGVTFLEWASDSSLGIRRLASLGNKCDVDEVELLEYLSNDPKTKVIALHLESIGDGRRLIEVAKEASKRKHIVVYKSGRTEAGAKAAKSHTGSLAGSYNIAVSAFKHAGMIVAESFEDLFDKSKALARQPPSRGNRIAIVTNCAGPSVSATDIAHERGFVVNLSSETVAKLRNILPPYAVVGLYVDLTGSATTDDFKKSLNLILRDPESDIIAVFVVFVNPAISDDVVEVIAKTLDHGKPLLCYATGGEYSMRLIRRLEELGVSTYPSAERLMNAVSGLIQAGQNRV
ncbi:MAG: CoA-binding protein, partial [Candidatus Bathyarchaeia archaeon]